MRRLVFPALALVLVLVACGEKTPPPEPAADLHTPRAEFVLHGGTIYTLRDDRPSPVEAIAIAEGRVLFAGARTEAEALSDENTRIIDLRGRFAMPGLVDAHAHLWSLGTLLGQADLRGTTSAEQCIDRARQLARELGEGEWITGRGWDQNDWAVKEYPTARMLDAAFGDRPVYLRRVDGHAAWVNRAALEAAGIGRDTPDPEGGEILRDADGQPTGILIDNAEDLVADVMGKPGPEEIERRYALASDAAVQRGLTGVHEMGISVERLRVLRRMDEAGKLPLRVVAYLGGDEELAKYEGGPLRTGDDARVRVEGVKLYADGALGSRGAALLEDYSDRPGHRGLLIQSPEELTARIERAFDRGFGVAIHAIGDRANRVAIDAIVLAHRHAAERDPQLPRLRDLRPRIEHAQIVHPDDLPRFAREGIIPSMQPTHCTSDMPWAPTRLGDARLIGAYAWRTLRDLDCVLPLGSDFPVEEVSPLFGLFAARTRQATDGTPPGGWSPAQRLDALESLLGFTVWPARALDIEGWGRLEPGMQADLTVLDVDPLGEDASALLGADVGLTMVAGRIVFESK